MKVKITIVTLLIMIIITGCKYSPDYNAIHSNPVSGLSFTPKENTIAVYHGGAFTPPIGKDAMTRRKPGTKLQAPHIIEPDEPVNHIDHAARLEVSKDNNKILTLALVASVFSSVLLFYQLTQRHRRERLLDTYAAETRLSKKIHDEIANELYTALHYIESEEVLSGVRKEKLIEQLDNIYLMTRNISRENNDIDTGLRFPGQLKLMLGTYSDTNVNVIVKGIIKINWDKIESTKKIATYRVLQELMVNMSKHSRATVVLLDFSIDRAKVKIVYSDNGVGACCKTLKSKNGLQNVENRMVSIGGNISFDTKAEKGFHITLIYPLPILYV